MIKVSIIIPIYNAEKYLYRCIKSVQEQKLREIEIILINDGSTDNSLEICKELSEKDSRIKVIDKKNEGVSKARNIGLEFVSGEYIGFVDSDDFIDPNMYLDMYEKVRSNNCEICYVNYFKYYSKKNIKINKSNFSEGFLNRETAVSKFIGNRLKNYFDPIELASVCRGIYSKKILKDIRFSGLNVCEDKLFNIEAFGRSNKTYNIDTPYYYYRFNLSSTTKNYSLNLIENFSNLNMKIFSINNSDNFREEIFFSELYSFLTVIQNECKNTDFNIFKAVKNIKKYAELNPQDKIFYKKLLLALKNEGDYNLKKIYDILRIKLINLENYSLLIVIVRLKQYIDKLIFKLKGVS